VAAGWTWGTGAEVWWTAIGRGWWVWGIGEETRWFGCGRGTVWGWDTGGERGLRVGIGACVMGGGEACCVTVGEGCCMIGCDTVLCWACCGAVFRTGKVPVMLFRA